MNTSNIIHSLTKDVSLTIRKGNYDLTIGRTKEKTSPPVMTTQQVTQPSPRPITRTPIAFQDVAFVFVLIALVAVAGHSVYRWKAKPKKDDHCGCWWWK
jgi:hypothetical protein